MFEKEAEEYADEKCGTIETEEKKFCRLDWQKGAEFGYSKAVKKMQRCENCKRYKPCVTVNETIGNQCEDYNNGCNNSVSEPFNKWEAKE